MRLRSPSLPLLFSLFALACGGATTSPTAAPEDAAVADTSTDDATDATEPGDASDDVAADATPSGPRPNIVVIMADDLDLGGFSRMLAAGKLPHIESAIAKNGVTFDNYFAANPLCCPSRASFLSGQYSHNTGVLMNGVGAAAADAGGPPQGSVAAFRDGSTLATWLHQAGYRTALVGKYMNGYGGVLPYGYSGGETADTYVPPGWDDWHALSRGTYNMFSYQFIENLDASKPRHGTVSPTYTMYQTDKLRDKAVSVIQDAAKGALAKKPLFLEVTTVAPHIEVPAPDAFATQFGGAIRPPPRYDGAITWDLPSPPSLNEADVSDKPNWIRNAQLTAAQLSDLTNLYRQRMEALMAVDDLVGAVSDALSASGRLENTVFVFMSDNGYLLGQHRTLGKQNPYEESIRVPLIVHLPGAKTPRTVKAFALNSDLAPTFAELAGATIPASYTVDGRSLVPLLDGTGPAKWRRRIAIEHWRDDEGGALSTPIPDYRGVRTSDDDTKLPNRMFDHLATGENELYDLGADPYELQSFGDSPSATGDVSTLQSTASSLHACSGASCTKLEDQ